MTAERRDAAPPRPHILTATLRTYDREVAADLAPVGCAYDAQDGLWRSTVDGLPWAERPDRRPPQSKKNDVETGEDQKGA